MNDTSAQLDALYLDCPRFDEGELYRSEAYAAHSARYLDALETLLEVLDPAQQVLFQQFLALTYDETEFEARHFFRAGVAASR
jgi:hypothetical protein